jgi:hypothetical protein
MLALSTPGACLENLKHECTIANYKIFLRCTVFLFGGLATFLPEEAFHKTPHSHPSLAVLLLCLEKHILWQHRYRPGSWGHHYVSITNTQASGFSLSTCRTSLESHVLSAFWNRPNNYRGVHHTHLARV